jgi:hypothetical protein
MDRDLLRPLYTKSCSQPASQQRESRKKNTAHVDNQPAASQQPETDGRTDGWTECVLYCAAHAQPAVLRTLSKICHRCIRIHLQVLRSTVGMFAGTYLWLWDGLSGVLRGDVLPIEQLDDLKALVLKPVQLGHFGCCVLGRGTLNV